jgi:peptidoglycan/LPS O-acetylase OafA/YrhL
MDTGSAQPRLPALTSLRFFAALHVVIFHLYAMNIATGTGWYRKLASIGYVGVSLFFVLSGFILVYTYGGRELKVGDFWRARFARIYPAYLFSLVLTAPGFFYVCLALKNVDIPYFAWFKTHLLLCSTLVPLLLQSWLPGAALAWNSPAWSLSDEAFFYLLFPLIVAQLMGSRIRTLLACVLICWAASLSLTTAYTLLKPDGVAYPNDQSTNLMWLNALKFNPLARLPEFLMGACFGFLFLRRTTAAERRDHREMDRKWATPLVLGGLLAFAAVVTLSPHLSYTILHDSLLAPAFVAIIYGLALRPGWASVFETKPLVLLGDASYSLYLLHATIIGIFFSPFGTIRHQSWGGIVVGIAISVVVSILVYLFLEEPARRWLRPKSKPPQEMAPAALPA